MSNIFLFDVDGTLTHPRNAMNERFAEFFYGFSSANPVYLVSGSDYCKLCEQVPEYIMNNLRGVFGCSGATYHVKGIEVYARSHEFDRKLVFACENYIEDSEYVFKTGKHLEYRTGMLNISTVGRNATGNQRGIYHKWDRAAGERQRMVDEINLNFPDYEASAGGEISIDIVPAGWNKSVVKKQVLEQHPAASIHFFGDRIIDNGNDLPLAQALDDGSGLHFSYSVSNFMETWKTLELGAIGIARKAA